VIRSRDATTPDREHGHTGLASGSVRTTNIGSTIGILYTSVGIAALLGLTLGRISPRPHPQLHRARNY
jgi:hypothetical protein